MTSVYALSEHSSQLWSPSIGLTNPSYLLSFEKSTESQSKRRFECRIAKLPSKVASTLLTLFSAHRRIDIRTFHISQTSHNNSSSNFVIRRECPKHTSKRRELISKSCGFWNRSSQRKGSSFVCNHSSNLALRLHFQHSSKQTRGTPHQLMSWGKTRIKWDHSRGESRADTLYHFCIIVSLGLCFIFAGFGMHSCEDIDDMHTWTRRD